jgi:hypothetical protein
VHRRFANRRDAPRTTLLGTFGLTLALLGGVLACASSGDTGGSSDGGVGGGGASGVGGGGASGVGGGGSAGDGSMCGTGMSTGRACTTPGAICNVGADCCRCIESGPCAGRWACSRAPNPVGCPSSAPQVGSSCAASPAGNFCTYCAASGPAFVICSGDAGSAGAPQQWTASDGLTCQ